MKSIYTYTLHVLEDAENTGPATPAATPVTTASGSVSVGQRRNRDDSALEEGLGEEREGQQHKKRLALARTEIEVEEQKLRQERQDREDRERKQLEEQERKAREEKLEEDRKRLESEKAYFLEQLESQERKENEKREQERKEKEERDRQEKEEKARRDTEDRERREKEGRERKEKEEELERERAKLQKEREEWEEKQRLEAARVEREQQEREAKEKAEREERERQEANKREAADERATLPDESQAFGAVFGRQGGASKVRVRPIMCDASRCRSCALARRWTMLGDDERETEENRMAALLAEYYNEDDDTDDEQDDDEHDDDEHDHDEHDADQPDDASTLQADVPPDFQVIIDRLARSMATFSCDAFRRVNQDSPPSVDEMCCILTRSQVAKVVGGTDWPLNTVFDNQSRKGRVEGVFFYKTPAARILFRAFGWTTSTMRL